jgi:hypothetical protein
MREIASIWRKHSALLLVFYALFFCNCHVEGYGPEVEKAPYGISPVSKATPDDAELIVAGRSAGHLQLGDTHERALELLGKPIEEYTYDENSFTHCRYTELHWRGEDSEYHEIFAYLKEGRIYQIEIFTHRFATTDKIKSGVAPQQVIKHHPSSQTYQLVGSGGQSEGGRDIIYWVDSNDGIAFGLYYSPQLKNRQVESISIFSPNADFLPKGCISQPQEWRKLKPFALDVPKPVRASQ